MQSGSRVVECKGKSHKIHYDFFQSEEKLNGAVILLHGFGGDKSHHKTLAKQLFEEKLFVLIPNMISLLGGAQSQEENINIVVEHSVWISENFSQLHRKENEPLPLFIGGHSAGGGVSIEAASLIQKRIKEDSLNIELRGVILLDAVPFSEGKRPSKDAQVSSRAIERIKEIEKPAKVVLFRAPEASWNAHALILKALKYLSPDVSVASVMIKGSTHIDPIDNPGFFARLICGTWTLSHYQSYSQLVISFVHSLVDDPLSVFVYSNDPQINNNNNNNNENNQIIDDDDEKKYSNVIINLEKNNLISLEYFNSSYLYTTK